MASWFLWFDATWLAKKKPIPREETPTDHGESADQPIIRTRLFCWLMIWLFSMCSGILHPFLCVILRLNAWPVGDWSLGAKVISACSKRTKPCT